MSLEMNYSKSKKIDLAYLEKQYGNFEAAIGHSLGGISLLNATRNGLKINQKE